jgi:hypothetical protein
MRFRPDSLFAPRNKWSRFDSHFDNEAFYNNIVDLYETDPQLVIRGLQIH